MILDHDDNTGAIYDSRKEKTAQAPIFCQCTCPGPVLRHRRDKSNMQTHETPRWLWEQYGDTDVYYWGSLSSASFAAATNCTASSFSAHSAGKLPSS